MAARTHPTGDPIGLPDEFADHLATVFAWDDPPETVFEWWRREAETMVARGWTPAPADFYVDGPTRHEVRLDDGVRYARSANDALAAAAMEAPGTVAVESVDPVSETRVTVEIGDDVVSVSPGDAAISFGLGPAAELPEPGAFESSIEMLLDGSVRDLHRFGNAFESDETYARWAAETDGVTFAASARKLAALQARLNRAP